MDEKELNALVSLLEDPDHEIASLVENRLLDMGDSVITQLETAWEQSFDTHIQQRLETIIHRIQFSNVRRELTAWQEAGSDDLLKGVLIINRYQYPDLKQESITRQLDEIKTEIWRQMSWEMNPEEKIKTFNHVFYQQFKFGANKANYQDPQNSYLNLVLESHKGNQISLAIIYSLVAQSLGLPVYGVNLPQHFVLAYSVAETSGQIPVEEPVRFYINAFNKGYIFFKKEIDLFLKQLNLTGRPEFYNPCSNNAIVLRIIRNLMGSYEKLGSEEKVRELAELLAVLDDSGSTFNDASDGMN